MSLSTMPEPGPVLSLRLRVVVFLLCLVTVVNAFACLTALAHGRLLPGFAFATAWLLAYVVARGLSAPARRTDV